LQLRTDADTVQHYLQPEGEDADASGTAAEGDAAEVASTSGQEPAAQQDEEALPEQQQQPQPQPPPEENQVEGPAQPAGDQQESTSGVGSLWLHKDKLVHNNTPMQIYVLACHAGRHEAGDGTHRSNMTCSTGTGLDSEALHSEMLHDLSAQASSLALSSRPVTAALGPHLRGSRPNSAAIAATIEGFENDFMVSRQVVLYLGSAKRGMPLFFFSLGGGADTHR
jgi:hypothetical protein